MKTNRSLQAAGARPGRRARLAPLLFAGLILLGGCKEPVSFAVYAEDGLIIRSGARIVNGDVGTRPGAAKAAEDEGYGVEILGAQIDGDVYGNSVRLDEGAVVRDVYANELSVGRATYRSLLPLPDNLPAVPVSPAPAPDAPALIVPPRTTMELTGRPSRVDVGTSATLVLQGGAYEIESLRMEEGSRLEAVEPSRLQISQSLEVGAGCTIGPHGEQEVLNLHVVVAGSDVNGVPKAVIGAESEVRALLTVPGGTLVMRNDVTAAGACFGRAVDIGASTSVEYLPGLELDTAQCTIFFCEGQATGGGTIQWTCSKQPLPQGTPCDDGNACTEGDACNGAGVCLSGDPLPSPDPQGTDPCVRDACDPVAGIYEPAGTVCDANVPCREPTTCDGSGNCQVPGAPLPQGTPCDDGIPNNEPDTCFTDGMCYGALGPYDCLANNCSPSPGAPPDVVCWLDSHPSIKTAVRWMVRVPPDTAMPLPWDQWEAWRRQELQQALEDAWLWYDGGMISFPGTAVPEPPTNHETLADNDYPMTVLDETLEAWPLYLAHLAQILMVEIKGLVPWSLCAYAYSPELMLLMKASDYYRCPPAAVFTGYAQYGPVTRAHPTATFPFMVQNGLIGQTRTETIAKVLDWARRMHHFVGPFTTKNMENHWQYRGLSPVSRVIQGTVIDPNAYSGFPDPAHWTMGCSGTSGFLKEVLRSVNIPVQVKYVPVQACPHATPYFPGEGLYLSHGDDPYELYWREGATSTVPPMEDFLIDQATYSAWFEGDPGDACNNIGRQPVALMVDWLPDLLVQQYCDDVANSATHAEGSVYQAFQKWYTVQELEAANLWSRLSQKATDLGLWCGGM